MHLRRKLKTELELVEVHAVHSCTRSDRWQRQQRMQSAEKAMCEFGMAWISGIGIDLLAARSSIGVEPHMVMVNVLCQSDVLLCKPIEYVVQCHTCTVCCHAVPCGFSCPFCVSCSLHTLADANSVES